MRTIIEFFSGGMLGLFLLGFFSAKVDNAQATIGVVLGLLVWSGPQKQDTRLSTHV